MNINHSRHRTVLFAVAIVIVLLLIGVGIFSAVIRQNNAATTSRFQGGATEINTAMHQYHDKYGHFPPSIFVHPQTGTRHSWRVLLLEFLNPATYAKYNFTELWDGPSNRMLSNRRPSCYQWSFNSPDDLSTAFTVVVGPNTAFPPTGHTSMADFQKGPGEVLLFVEVVDHQIHWMEPSDLTIDMLTKSDGSTIYDPVRRGYAVGCMADSIKVNLHGLPSSRLSDMITIRR